jgi:hypothetical protein
MHKLLYVISVITYYIFTILFPYFFYEFFQLLSKF